MRKEEMYEKVCGILSCRKRFPQGRACFADICRKAGAARVAMDNMFYERLGLSGDEAVMLFRKRKVRSK